MVSAEKFSASRTDIESELIHCLPQNHFLGPLFRSGPPKVTWFGFNSETRV